MLWPTTPWIVSEKKKPVKSEGFVWFWVLFLVLFSYFEILLYNKTIQIDGFLSSKCITNPPALLRKPQDYEFEFSPTVNIELQIFSATVWLTALWLLECALAMLPCLWGLPKLFPESVPNNIWSSCRKTWPGSRSWTRSKASGHGTALLVTAEWLPECPHISVCPFMSFSSSISTVSPPPPPLHPSFPCFLRAGARVHRAVEDHAAFIISDIRIRHSALQSVLINTAESQRAVRGRRLQQNRPAVVWSPPPKTKQTCNYQGGA